MRGGTSKGLVFKCADLPADHGERDRFFLAAMGSPDPYGRQLDGLGGGLSSLSKVCVVGPSSRADADLDYQFGQVLIGEARVDWSGNCGNMSAAIGPFAFDEGLVSPRPDADGQVTVDIHNTNTGKIIRSTFRVRDGRAVEAGELSIPGVAGSGSPIRLDFLDPGGAITGRLLPTGRPADRLAVPGLGPIEVSMVDAAVAAVFVRAESLGLSGTESPQVIEQIPGLVERLLAIRAAAAMAMGIAATDAEARARLSVPVVGFVSPAQACTTLDGGTLAVEQMDLTVRMIASGQPHRALPLTASVCLAVAARLPGSVVYRCVSAVPGEELRLGMPSGVLKVAAEVERVGEAWAARRGAFYRTARRLFDGWVYASER